MQKMRGLALCSTENAGFRKCRLHGKIAIGRQKNSGNSQKTCTICMNALQNGTRRLAADEKNDMYKIQENFPKIFTLQTACRVI